jgi:hypothetical protein
LRKFRPAQAGGQCFLCFLLGLNVGAQADP